MSNTQTANITNIATERTPEQIKKAQEYRDVCRLAAKITKAHNSENLSDWEKNFLADMAKRFTTYGAKTAMSLKQTMLINRVLKKAA